MSDLLLAIDTATEVTVVGIARDASDGLEVLASAQVDAPRAALSRVLPIAVELLGEAGLEPADITAVVAGRGPGSFTGVRIGVAVAKGVAHGLGEPLWGVGTLDAVAWRFAGHEGLLGVVGDAMRGEIYPALFACEGGRVRRLSPDAVRFPSHLAEEWAEQHDSLLLAGNGLRKHLAAFEEAFGPRIRVAEQALWAPDAAGLFSAFSAQREAGLLGSGSADDLLPVYTRLSDAEENERIRAGRVGADVPGTGVAGGGRS